MSKTEHKKDCLSCLHKNVCMYTSHYMTLSSIASTKIIFQCRLYLGKELPEQTKQNMDHVLDKGISVDELAKKIDRDNDEKTKQDFVFGVCSICNKEQDNLVKCKTCEQMICLSCCEAEEQIDVTTGASVTSYICQKCNEDSN